MTLPPARRVLRWALLGAVTLPVLAVAAVVAAWMWHAEPGPGLEAVSRLARFGLTSVDDYRHYPARTLAPGPLPAPFQIAGAPAAAPPVPGCDGRTAPLDALVDASDTLALLVIRDDAMLYERYALGHSATSVSQYFSVTKSVFATLVAMAADDGILGSIARPVTDNVPELAANGFGRVTLEHLLDMRSGIDYRESENPFGLHPPMNYTPDVTRMLLRFRLAEPPGERFEYRSSDTALLALVLQRALRGETISAYAQRRLWGPLGMEDRGLWSLDHEDGLEKSWCCLAGTARDLAKLGRLYLHRGVWNGQRLLSEHWIDRALRLNTAPGGGRMYAFSWWPASPRGTDFMAVGKDGQFLYVQPSSRTLVVRLGRSEGCLSKGQWTGVFITLGNAAW